MLLFNSILNLQSLWALLLQVLAHPFPSLTLTMEMLPWLHPSYSLFSSIIFYIHIFDNFKKYDSYKKPGINCQIVCISWFDWIWSYLNNIAIYKIGNKQNPLASHSEYLSEKSQTWDLCYTHISSFLFHFYNFSCHVWARTNRSLYMYTSYIIMPILLDIFDKCLLLPMISLKVVLLIDHIH